MTRVRKLIATLGLALLSCAVVRAAGPSRGDSASALRGAVNSDELDLAALVARVGDDAVVASLTEGDTVLQLAAVRAAPFLQDAELALSPLVAIAQGRDPDVAPAAARSLLAIAQALLLEPHANPEPARGTCRALKQPLLQLANDADARADVRVAAGAAAHLLCTRGHG